MIVGSLFSGVGGFDKGLEDAGHTIAFQCEADEFRQRVLAARFPGVPCYSDVRDVGLQLLGGRFGTGPGLLAAADKRDGAERSDADSRVDLLTGGFPCQDLSVAGRRAGLMHEGGRSNLFFECARVADELLRPGGWLLLENVPGLLSSNGGRDFAVLLATLADLGFHDLAWRVLDSRFFGVPQRRRRVFILARRARGGRARAVLLEPESSGGDLTAGGEAGQGVAGTLGGGSGSRGWAQDVERMTFVPDTVAPVMSKWAKGTGGPAGDEAQNLVADTLTSGSHPASNMPGRRREDDTNLVAATLKSENGRGWATSAEAADNLIAEPTAYHFRTREDGSCFEETEINVSRASVGGSGGAKIALDVPAQGVRRLTPTECERLQGFPDGWTAIPGAPDSRRYAAMGDAVTVPVARWIGQRLARYGGELSPAVAPAAGPGLEVS
jgi:DNA (cytosine-5)-methyltransferase 1